MPGKKIIISGTGCALADFLYTPVSFTHPVFRKYGSAATGDGGLSPGKLVFTGELERFAGKSYPAILGDMLGARVPDAFNVGGPSLVSLIHASQLLEQETYQVCFYGVAGADPTADRIIGILRKTPLDIGHYLIRPGSITPFTDVFSDPDYGHGHGERTFINNIGAAWEYTPEQLDDGFFSSDIVCFGGTALVPRIHDNLSSLLLKARQGGCLTVVNTVFDFRNEKANPGKPWPLVKNPDDFNLIDLLIMDTTEALSISGRTTVEEALSFFSSTGVGSFVITNGALDLVAASNGQVFHRTEPVRLPVSEQVTGELRMNPDRKGDTTGCGDNFAGGMIASVAWQIKERSRGNLDLIEALSWAVASGGFCCYTVGGTWLEEFPGQKREEVGRLRKAYLNQIGWA